MIKERKGISYRSKHEAFPFQVDTLAFVKDLEYSAIFHEQGLGKTKIAIDLALTWLANKVVESVIIITKKGLIRNWEQEIAQHSYFKAKTLDQDPQTLFYAFNSPWRLYLTHYEACKSCKGTFALFLKTRRVAVICDESQKIKNPDSALAKAMHSLSPGFCRRVIMTGTPIANRPYDIWSQIWFLDHGNSLGNDFAKFQAELDLPKEEAEGGMFEQALGSVYNKIKAFTIRDTKSSCGIVLPNKEIENVLVEFEPAQQQLYFKFRDEMLAEVLKDGNLRVDNADAILKRLLRLVQVASNPTLVDERYKGIPGKMTKLMDILEPLIRAGSKAIVWTCFTENADWLAKELKVFGSAKVHGKLAIEDRNAAIARFKTDPECKILVATPGAAKEGLTLTVANYAIFYDRSFSLDDYLQSQDRIHRISQNQTCYIYNLLLRDSIDEWVDELLTAKQIAAQLGQGDINPEQFREKMSYDFSTMLANVLNLNPENLFQII